jgi:hypothetical protein
MKKFLLILSIYILFISPVSADFFDNWSDDNICGWMDNPSTPKYIMEERDKREEIKIKEIKIKNNIC